MAEENTRPGRGRKKDGTTDAAGKQKKATTAKGRTRRPPRRRRRRRRVGRSSLSSRPREAIAEQAYLLWERGEPGGETDHWLRAEAELRAA